MSASATANGSMSVDATAPSYASSSFVGSSLWLMPHDPHGRLARLRFEDAGCGGVPFAPHVTLLAGVGGPPAELVPAVEALAARLGGPVPLAVDGAGARSLYFQCVYATIARGGALLAANDAARAAFDRGGDPAYAPHMSVVYGDLDEASKAPLLARVREELAGAEFPARSIEVWSTQGTVPEWFPVAVVSLVGEPTRWLVGRE